MIGRRDERVRRRAGSRAGRLGRFGGQRAERTPRRRQRVVAAVRVMLARGALLLDIRHLAVGRDLAVVAGYTTTGERRKAKESNQTHHEKLRCRTDEQFLYRRAARSIVAREIPNRFVIPAI